MLPKLNYYIHKLLKTNHLDFIDMGLGIEARAMRCKKYWQAHLQLTRNFIADSISTLTNCKALTVLGAGRLYDLDLKQFDQFSSINLLDADPNCKYVWQKACQLIKDNNRFNFEIADASGSIQHWTDQFKAYLQAQSHSMALKDAAEFLSAFKIQANSGLHKVVDVNISLNLLSQIPIYWRDRVQQLLLRFCKIDSDQHGNYPEPFNTALLSSMAKLQNDHIERLKKSSRQAFIIISDHYFNYYRQDQAEWQTLPALYFKEFPAVDPFQLVKQDSWLWHIAPQYVEQDEYGIIHEVQAGLYELQ